MCTCSIRAPLLCVLELLIDELGADVNAATPSGLSPLHLAAEYDNAGAVALLLEKGADPLVEDDVLKRTPLHLAAAYGGADTASALLDAGGEAACRTSAFGTPLKIADRRPRDRATRGVVRLLKAAAGDAASV